MKQEILDRLNEIIIEEKGVRVTMDSLFRDSQLDSLGTVITIATLEGDYPSMFADIPLDQEALSTLNFETLTVRELVRKCISSKKSTLPEASSETSK
jgi:acyl carrier protein